MSLETLLLARLSSWEFAGPMIQCVHFLVESLTKKTAMNSAEPFETLTFQLRGFPAIICTDGLIFAACPRISITLAAQPQYICDFTAGDCASNMLVQHGVHATTSLVEVWLKWEWHV